MRGLPCLRYRTRLFGAVACWMCRRIRDLLRHDAGSRILPEMTADTGTRGDPVMSLARLAAIDEQYEIEPELEGFVAGYAQWVADQEGNATEQADDDQAAAGRLLAECYKPNLGCVSP